MDQAHRGQAQVAPKGIRWVNNQPDVNVEEDALEQMLLLEVYMLRHFDTGLQAF